MIKQTETLEDILQRRADTFKLASSENMTIDVAYKLAGLVGIKDTSYKGIPWESPQYEYDMEQLDFARNTLLFADASNAAKKAITSKIATMGQTGYATGNHSHMTVNGSGKEFGTIYSDFLNSNDAKYDSYSEFMTGYTNTSYFNNDLLWSNVYKYSIINDGKKWLNYNDYYNQHYIEKFYNFSGK